MPQPRASEAIKLRVVYRPLADIQPYERNARQHTVAQITAIKRSLGEFGWTSPMLVGDNELIAGHARHRAASEIAAEGGAIPGIPDARLGPVIDLSHLPPDKRRAYVLADNRLAELAGWDMDLLRSELEDLAQGGIDTTLIGYTGAELATLLGGWNVDFSKIERMPAVATDQLGLIMVQCRRDQLAAVEAVLRAALAGEEGFANVTVRAH